MTYGTFEAKLAEILTEFEADFLKISNWLIFLLPVLLNSGLQQQEQIRNALSESDE